MLTTVRDAYPLPFVNGILDELRQAKFLSSLDIKSAFWQIPLTKVFRPITAFVMPNRDIFQFKIVPFGLRNSRATWQRLKDSVLGADLKPFVFCDLDDIIVTKNIYKF